MKLAVMQLIWELCLRMSHQSGGVHVCAIYQDSLPTQVAWWCNGYGVGLAFDRSRVRFPAIPLPSSDLGQVVHTHVPVTKQYNLVPAKGQWCSAAGKVTVGLASHWPCVTDFSGLSTYGPKGYEREMSTPPMLWRGKVEFSFFLKVHNKLATSL